jgi:hypothetical protein
MSIEDDIIVKKPTKPEGPAQEPTGARGWGYCFDHQLETGTGPCPKCCVPATPAPSQPAGAREWLLENGYLDPHGTTRTYTLEGEEGRFKESKELAEVLSEYAAQQTAAKDAEIERLTQEANLWYDEREAELELRRAAESERDSLRVENAALKAGKAGKEGQQ